MMTQSNTQDAGPVVSVSREELSIWLRQLIGDTGLSLIWGQAAHLTNGRIDIVLDYSYPESVVRSAAVKAVGEVKDELVRRVLRAVLADADQEVQSAEADDSGRFGAECAGETLAAQIEDAVHSETGGEVQDSLQLLATVFVGFPPPPAVQRLRWTFWGKDGQRVLCGVTDRRGQFRPKINAFQQGKEYTLKVETLFEQPEDECARANIEDELIGSGVLAADEQPGGFEARGPAAADPEKIRELIERLRDKDSVERVAAAEALGLLGIAKSEILDLLLRASREDQDDSVRQCARRALRSLVGLVQEFHSQDGIVNARIRERGSDVLLEVDIDSAKAGDRLAAYRITDQSNHLLDEGFVALYFVDEEKQICSGEIMLDPAVQRSWSTDCYMEVFAQPRNTVTARDREILQRSLDGTSHPDARAVLGTILDALPQDPGERGY